MTSGSLKLARAYLNDKYSLCVRPMTSIMSTVYSKMSSDRTEQLEQNYFTCTLEYAAKRKLDGIETSFTSILHMIEEQALVRPNSPALGFVGAEASKSNDQEPITFGDVWNRSIQASNVLFNIVGTPAKCKSSNIAMMCESSQEFVFTWLGLMHLGWTTAILAPQLSLQDISHLCTALQFDTILASRRYKTTIAATNLQVLNIPRYESNCVVSLETTASLYQNSSGVAYYCHSSGTSSGRPKPIAQPHSGVVTCLPRFEKEDQFATFSTTPLYHGGLPDCLRTWASGALIWLLLETESAVTKTRIVHAVREARNKCDTPVKYFSSVPYIMQLMAEQDDGVELLLSMDLVGVGGASLPEAVGNALVQKGVKLLSRYGSSEYGFLMSSHRAYDTDKDWQYLRLDGDLGLLTFESCDNNLSELVIRPGWPLLSMPARFDGLYNTRDLFESHPQRRNAWRYTQRADTMITLLNGKKFDPFWIEEALMKSCHKLSNVLIVGSNREFPGCLLFTKMEYASAEDFLSTVWSHIETINAESSSHSRIRRSSTVVIAEENSSTIPKSSKGTMLRRATEEKYADLINSIYEDSDDLSGVVGQVQMDDLLKSVMTCFRDVLGRDIDPDEDIFRQGVDSVDSGRIRKRIAAECLGGSGLTLPINAIYETGTVTRLVEYIQGRKGVGKIQHGIQEETALQQMLQLSFELSQYPSLHVVPRTSVDMVVLLTGATGFLGAHVLHLLRHHPRVRKVFCLVRSPTPAEAHQRVTLALARQNLPGLDRFIADRYPEPKVVCVPGDVTRPDLSLAHAIKTRILQEVTLVLHSAWAVSFNLQLPSFKGHLLGTKSLLVLAAQAKARFVFISSTAAVVNSKQSHILEGPSSNPKDAADIGYGRSKWVAESICAHGGKALFENHGRNTSNRGDCEPVSIIRVGQLCGAADGVWNSNEAYPAMLSTASLTGCLPSLPGEALDWLPVDLAAQGILDIALALTRHDISKRDCLEKDDTTAGDGCGATVYHVANQLRNPTWQDMLEFISSRHDSPPFVIVSPTEWLDALHDKLSMSRVEHPYTKLLDFWTLSLRLKETKSSGHGESSRHATFDTLQASQISSTIAGLTPLELGHAFKMWEWVRQVSDKYNQ